MLNPSIPTADASDAYAPAGACDVQLNEAPHTTADGHTGSDGGSPGDEAIAEPHADVAEAREPVGGGQGPGLAERLDAVRANITAGLHGASAVVPPRPELVVSNALDMEALGLRHWSRAQAPMGARASPQDYAIVRSPVRDGEQLEAAAAPDAEVGDGGFGPPPWAAAEQPRSANVGPVAAVSGSVHRPAPPLAPEIAQAVPPLVDAFGAAAQLAADANAAAEALENLKRLLETRLSAAAGPAAMDAPLHHASTLSGPAPKAPKAVRTLPRASMDRSAPRRSWSVPEGWHKDLRGFFAGMAISAAFGVVFYLFMIAG